MRDFFNEHSLKEDQQQLLTCIWQNVPKEEYKGEEMPFEMLLDKVLPSLDLQRTFQVIAALSTSRMAEKMALMTPD